MFTVKRSLYLALATGCSFGIFLSVDAVRDSSWVHTVMVDVREQKLENYIFGSPAAFADWFGHADPGPPEWGARTFAGEFDLLGLKTRIAGRYLETSNIVGTESTNVYTLFRGLVEDFTPAGAVLVSVFAGWIAGFLYRWRVADSLVPWLGMSAFYAAFLYSPIVSFFSFNGPTLAWLVAAIVLARAQRRASAGTTPALTLQGAPAR